MSQINETLKRQIDENEEQYIWRIGQLVDAGKFDSWKEITATINEQWREDETQYRTESAYRKKYKNAKLMYEAVFAQENRNGDAYLQEVKEQKWLVQQELMKVQTEKLELNRWLRENARDSLICDKIIDAIKELPPLSVPDLILISHSTREGALLFGDEHYGVQFKIPGLYGEVINSYDPEIFEIRMWNLLNQTVEIAQREGFNTINVYSMGDFIDGILRVSQLFKLKYGVVESTVRYSDFICHWLNKLSEYVRINFQMVHGNHSELRMLGQPKGTFTEDNMGLIVLSIIETRLKDNPNFKIIKNPTGLIFENMCGFNVLGIHGEVKNMEKALKDFSNTYNTPIDILIGGHIHHTKAECVGVNRDVVNVPSIIGIDSFSMLINKTSSPGATFIIVEERKGKVQEYNIKLN